MLEKFPSKNNNPEKKKQGNEQKTSPEEIKNMSWKDIYKEKLDEIKNNKDIKKSLIDDVENSIKSVQDSDNPKWSLKKGVINDLSGKGEAYQVGDNAEWALKNIASMK